MTTAALSIRDLQKTYDNGFQALKGISFEVQPGDFFALPGIAILCVCFALSSAALGLYMVPLQAAAQRRAPPERRARILAAGNMLNALAAMAGSLSVLFVTNTGLSPNNALLFVAALQAAIALYMGWRWRRVPQGLHDDKAA